MNTLFHELTLDNKQAAAIIPQGSLLWSWLDNKKVSKRLELLAGVLVVNGKAKNMGEAIAFLVDLAADFDTSNVAIISSDLGNTRRKRSAWEMLEKLRMDELGEKGVTQPLTYRQLGALSHAAIYDLFAGRLPQHIGKPHTHEESPAFEFGQRYIRRYASEGLSVAYLQDIYALTMEAVSSLETSDRFKKLTSTKRWLRELVPMLLPIFGHHVERALRHNTDLSTRLLVLLTLLSCAQLKSVSRTSKRVDRSVLCRKARST